MVVEGSFSNAAVRPSICLSVASTDLVTCSDISERFRYGDSRRSDRLLGTAWCVVAIYCQGVAYRLSPLG